MAESQAELEIFNLALGHLGNRAVTTPDQSPECQLFYPEVRDTVLSWNRWAFNTTRKALVQLADTPASGFSFQFALPQAPPVFSVLAVNDDWWDSEFFRVRYKFETFFRDAEPDNPIPVILTNHTSHIVLRFTTRVSVRVWPPLVKSCAALLLAARIAQTKSQKSSLQTALISQFEGQLERAIDIDGHQDSPEIAGLDYRYDVVRGDTDEGFIHLEDMTEIR